MIFQSRMTPAPAGAMSFNPPNRTVQRKCACGGTPGPTGECAECKRKRLSLQPKLAINQPGDRYEQEADRVAEAIVSGAGSARPSISSLCKGGAVQREEPAKPKTEEEKYKEAAKKVGEAFLETPPGKEIEKKAEELGDAFISTLPGKIITGAAVTGAIATLAATHKELPIGIPEIPLDKIKPGLKMKITYEGPVDKPTKVMASFSIPLGRDKTHEKKPALTESEKFRAETARMAADQAKFREGLKTDEEKASEKPMMDSYLRSKMLRPDQLTPRTSPLSFGVAGEQLGFHPGAPATGARSPLGPWAPDLKLTGETQGEEPKKKEEETLQRKAAGDREISGAPPIVDEVLQSSGQPLDSATRAFMQERFGHDFGSVRVHTDARAAQSARAVDALAYTVGEHLVFAAGSFAPGTHAGQRLLAHELTHTMQQTGKTGRLAGSSLASRRIGSFAQMPPTLARKKGPVGTSGKLRAIANWSYVVYGDEIRLRYYDKGPEGKAETQIGTIPWITNNPGNLTISPNITPAANMPTSELFKSLTAGSGGRIPMVPKKFPIPEICKSTKKEDAVSPDSLQALPINLGAVGLYACRYAIFPSLEAGMDAIVPHLRGIAEKAGNPNMTVEQALRNFKGLEKGEKAEMERQRKAGLPVVDVRDSYVAAIKAHMTKIMTANEALEIGETPEGLSADELKAIMKDIQGRIQALMGKKILDVTDADTDMRHIVRGLVQKEGYAAPPGVIFKCSGFETGAANLYDGQQKALTSALTGSREARDELGLMLECK